MRLLDCSGGAIRLTKDLIGNVPSYAILSHTWGPDGEEVTFRDLIDGTGEGKKGYEKIWFCASKALGDGLRYCWMDTCCIDKANSTELFEAINSMYNWYKNAARCYVYLSDVSDSNFSRDVLESEAAWRSKLESSFSASRWFTRVWTLQELLAPSSVEFFTKEGLLLGNKATLEQQIHDITGIAVPALRNSPLHCFDLEERFRWAEKRDTTRAEDWAYSLLGIFGVYMPLIYGEGRKNAIRRLKREIADVGNREDTPEPVIQRTQHNQSSGATAKVDLDYDSDDEREKHIVRELLKPRSISIPSDDGLAELILGSLPGREGFEKLRTSGADRNINRTVAGWNIKGLRTLRKK